MILVCRYAPHWGTVKPFLHSEKRLPTLPTTFGIRTIDDGPLANYLEDYREIFDLGLHLPQGIICWIGSCFCIFQNGNRSQLELSDRNLEVILP